MQEQIHLSKGSTGMTHIERLQLRGIRRSQRGKRSFAYETPDGRQVSRADAARIDGLRIPPAWTHVAINPAASGRLQAIGKDQAGRWQYRYHIEHVKAQDRKKFNRLVHFGRSIPAMRSTVARHLLRPGLSRERVMACMLKILALSFLRPGSEIYANEHGSYGITTLRFKHVTVSGDRLVFDFSGKSGVQQHRELRNRQVARVIKDLLKQPGRRVFRYEDDEGRLVDVTPRHINTYIKEVMGDRFSAKDFRTWAGTLICASALARANANGERELPAKKKVRLALMETANALGNTPAVCRSSYVCPSILNRFDRGKVVSRYFGAVEELIAYRGTSLHPAERALLQFLK
jgi:DNA topoisomerase I